MAGEKPLVYNGDMVREVAERTETIAALCRDLGVQRLYLFGSATSGATMADVHDLDFLVRFKPLESGQYARNYFALAEKLEELFKTRIDLVEMDNIDNPYFRKAVELSKVPVYEST